MKELDKSMIDTCAILRGVNTKQVLCLSEFISCRALVCWIKESMQCKLHFIVIGIYLFYALGLKDLVDM